MEGEKGIDNLPSAVPRQHSYDYEMSMEGEKGIDNLPSAVPRQHSYDYEMTMEGRKDYSDLPSASHHQGLYNAVTKYCVHETGGSDVHDNEVNYARAVKFNFEVPYDNIGYVTSLAYPNKEHRSGSHYPKKGWEAYNDASEKITELRPYPVAVCIDNENDYIKQWHVAYDNKGYIMSSLAGSGVSKKWKDRPIGPEIPQEDEKLRQKSLPVADVSGKFYSLHNLSAATHLNQYGVEMCSSDYDEESVIMRESVAKKRIVPMYVGDKWKAQGKGH